MKISIWIKENQGKHFCYCPCHQEIIIKRHHHWYGVPKYIIGHNNLGKKFTQDHKDKISKSHMNKIFTELHRNKLSDSHIGKIPWNKGLIGVYSEETLKINSDKHKGKIPPNIGKRHSEITREKMRKAKENISEETKNKMSKNHADVSGVNNPRWLGGISFQPYCEKFNEKKKEEVRNQYNRQCYICSKNEKDNITKTNKLRKLSVHHTDFDKEQGCNGKSWKLIPVCMVCHPKIKRGD